jgi:hypothetical protein
VHRRDDDGVVILQKANANNTKAWGVLPEKKKREKAKQLEMSNHT